MTTAFVTRHAGTIDWAQSERLLPEGSVITATFDAEDVQPGDLVIGTLPAHLAARICERGGRYQHLTLDLPENLRGQDLTVAEMRACNARLEEFHIQRSTVRPGGSEQVVHIVLASGENLPNLIPALAPAFKAGQVIILASKAMRANADKLRHGLHAAGLPESDIRLRDDCPDHDLADIITRAQHYAAGIAAEYPAGRLILNLTGGNKLMTIGFLQAFRACAEIIYCDTERSRIDYFHPIGRASEKLPVNLLGLAPYLAVQGFKLRPASPDTGGITARQQLTQALVDGAPRMERLIGDLNKAAFFYREGRSERARLDTPSHANDRKLVDLMVDRGLLKGTGHHLAIVGDIAASYLGGGWLEEWCWLIGKELEQGEPGRRLHAKRWGINLQIDPWNQPDIPGRGQHPLNELDANHVHRNRMLLIECKSGVQISERGESQDILNKLETLGKHVAGRLDTKWLLTARRIDRNTQALQRAKEYGIHIVKPDDLADLKSAILAWMTR